MTNTQRTIELLDFPNNLRYMDVSENRIQRIRNDYLDGMHSLMFLNLTANAIEIIDQEAFSDLTNLEELILKHNLLGIHKSMPTFNSLHTLQYLDISFNKISAIEKNLISECVNLDILDLSHNNLDIFEPDLSSLRKIRMLILSTNRIQTIAEPVRNSLNNIARHHNLTVNLFDNKFVCNCKTVDFLKWLLFSNITFEMLEKYSCTLTNGTVVLVTKSLIPELEYECKQFIAVIIFATAFIFVFITSVSCLTIYRFRWHILYWYYLGKLGRNRPARLDMEPIYDWNIYLAYDDADFDFIHRKLLPTLEGEMNYHVHVRDRDFMAGEITAVNILNGIRSSKKTVVIFSENFVENEWSKFEVNMALVEGQASQREVLVLVFLGEVQHVPRDFAALLSRCSVVEYPEDEKVEQAFWRTLADLVDK